MQLCKTRLLNSLTLSGFESLNKKNRNNTKLHCFCFGALQGIRTPDLLVRSQTLYPAELAAHFLTLIYYSTEFQKIKCFFEKVLFFYEYLLFVRYWDFYTAS